MKLNLEKQIVIAATRTVIQLLLIGLILKSLFSHTHFIWAFSMAMIMLIAAGREISARQTRKLAGGWHFWAGISAMFVSSFILTTSVLIIIIEAKPWYTPQYAIPLLGMMLGNTMNGISLAMDRLIQNIWQQKPIIEQRLMLGETYQQAIIDIKRESIRAGMTPIINSMAAAGIVSLPGMMTGQILAGSPPVEAVKYQILIMFLIASGTGFGIIAALQIIIHRLFDDRHRLRLDQIQKIKLKK